MSVAIIGGNECMTQKYIDICKGYKCDARIYKNSSKAMKNIGSPDIMILFIGAMSHKMLAQVSSAAKNPSTKVIRCHTSSASALKNALETCING